MNTQAMKTYSALERLMIFKIELNTSIIVKRIARL